MRLNAQEVNGILKAIHRITGSIKTDLYLYGSRVDDTKKGGDIDLLLIVYDTQSKAKLLSEKHLMTSQIKSNIGDQKIDLKIALEDELEQDPFLKLATEGSKKVRLE